MIHHSDGKTLAVAVVGASTRRTKYGNRAVRAYRAAGWVVYPIHPTASAIEALPAFRSVLDVPGPIDRATIYLPPHTVLSVLPELAAKSVPEVWLNPGSESEAVIARGEELGLRLVLACSIIDIGRSPENPD